MKIPWENPEGIAVSYVQDGCLRNVSNQQLKDRVASVAGALHASGLKTGDRIGMYFDDIDAGLVLYLASNSLGLSPVGISPMFSFKYLEQVLIKAEATTVLIPEGLDLDLSTEIMELHWRRNVSALLGISIDLHSSSPPEFPSLDPDSRACLITTSGSTGAPKLVSRSHASWFYAAGVFSVGFKRDSAPPERILLNARISHALGVAVMMTSLRLGATMCIPKNIDIQTSLVDLNLLDPSLSSPDTTSFEFIPAAGTTRK